MEVQILHGRVFVEHGFCIIFLSSEVLNANGHCIII